MCDVVKCALSFCLEVKTSVDVLTQSWLSVGYEMDGGDIAELGREFIRLQYVTLRLFYSISVSYKAKS